MLDTIIKDERGTFFPLLSQYISTFEELRREGYEFCSDLCGVDYLDHYDRQLPAGITGERFEVVVNLTSFQMRTRVRVRVQVGEAEPVLPSLFNLYAGSEAMEREVYDLFGIVFEGHPDLSRILLPEEWEGHPLRKDYSVGRVPVQFKASQATR